MLATVIMGFAAYLAYKYTFIFTDSKSLSALLSILLAVISYGVSLILVKGIAIDELQMAPGGGKLSRVLKKKGLLK